MKHHGQVDVSVLQISLVTWLESFDKIRMIRVYEHETRDNLVPTWMKCIQMHF